MSVINKYFIAFGANLGEIEENFKKAAKLIEQRLGKITLKSSLYSSEALTLDDTQSEASSYINCVVQLESEKSEQELLEQLNLIEQDLGRVRKKKWDSRIIDLDIIANAQNVISTKSLSIPHKEMHKRTFVLVPLLEIAPNWKHPLFNKTAKQLIDDLKEKTPCEILKSFPDYES